MMPEFSSPKSNYQEGYYQNNKFKRINDRWNEIQNQIDREKQMRKQQAQQQLFAIDDRLTKNNSNFDTIIKQQRERIREVTDLLGAQKTNRITFQQKTDLQIKQIEENIIGTIQQQRKNKQELEQSWCKDTDQRLLVTCSNYQQQNFKNEEQLQGVLLQVKNKITNMENTILIQRKKRQQATTEVTEHIEGELNRIHNRIGIQKKVRQETQSKLFKMIDDVQAKLNHEINVQRTHRLQTKEALLRLLEQTCYKVEVNFR